ncbi:MAG TPA: hypothetical protein VGN57_19030 [Pirellulaceae bacterium]|jgi:hypothetical protein|nr:hypothetical protein [Pirellulaceae bacterium]
MAEAKNVKIEITDGKVIEPRSVFEKEKKNRTPRVFSLGEVVEVYEDVAEKLVTYKKAVRLDKDTKPSIAESMEKHEEEEKARRAELLSGPQTEKKAEKKTEAKK